MVIVRKPERPRIISNVTFAARVSSGVNLPSFRNGVIGTDAPPFHIGGGTVTAGYPATVDQYLSKAAIAQLKATFAERHETLLRSIAACDRGRTDARGAT
jgi:hypothetical protein